MSMKTLQTTFSDRERYAVWCHLEKNVLCNTGREQDQVDDIRDSLKLEQIQELVDEAPRVLGPLDFSTETQTPAELTKEEVAFLVGLLNRPIPASLARFTLPIKRRLQKESDQKGLKAVAAEGE